MKTINYFHFSNFTQLSAIILSIVLTIAFSNGIVAQTQLDTSFNAGVSEAPATVYVSTTLSNGKILVGGQFNLVNDTERGFLARLNSDGTLDDSFNPGFGPNNSVYEIIELPDGKILVGGSFIQYNGVNIKGLVRLNADGSLDTSFNPGGSGVTGSVQGMTLQPDGKILISGSSISSYNGVAGKFSVTRVNPDGTLDTSFNSPFTSAVFVEEVDVQADGRILVGGDFSLGTPTRTDIVRLNPNGSIDSSFNAGGGGTTGAGIYAMTLQPDGKILIGGDFTSYNFEPRPSLARLNPDGSLDSSFLPPGFSSSSVEYFAIQTDGKILIAGSFSAISNNPFPVIRLNPDGSFDNSFQANIADNTGYNVKLQPNGQIILTGYFNNYGAQPRNGIVRLSANGFVDNAFNASFFGFGAVHAIAQQADGKVIVGGIFRRANGSFNVNVARFNPDGTLDANFITGSGANSGNLDFFNTVSAIAVQPDGKILLGGRFYGFNGTISPGIVRLNNDGSVDTSFTNPLDRNNINIILDILVLPDGKILAGGAGMFYNFNQFSRLLRLNPNGTIDTTFNSGAGPNSNVNKLVRQPDGKILVGGLFTTYNGTARSRIARINIDGTLDTTFNPGTGANASLFDIALQADEKVLLGGNFTTINAVSRNRIARLNADGSLDTSFNVGDGANSTVLSIAIEPSGKIIIGGGFAAYNNIGGFRLARLNADGSFDNSFNSAPDGSATSVRKLLFQTDGRLLVGGTFTSFSAAQRRNLARLVTFASVSGRITNTKGAGVAGATVTLTNANGVTRTVIADSLGYYQFGDVEAFQNYVIGVSAKRHRFNPSSKTITVNGNLSNVNFVALRGS